MRRRLDSLVGDFGPYLQFPQAAGGEWEEEEEEAAGLPRLISSNDQTAGGHFPAGSKTLVHPGWNSG